MKRLFVSFSAVLALSCGATTDDRLRGASISYIDSENGSNHLYRCLPKDESKQLFDSTCTQPVWIVDTGHYQKTD